MAEKKRFQKQSLNRDDYVKIEEGAKAAKGLAAAAVAVGVFARYAPKVLNSVRKIVLKA